jgi:hypothetical protein
MSSTKDMMKAMEARLLALEEKLATLSVAPVAKKARKSKKDSDNEDKPKREFKPSAARDAWRSLCDAVRTVHKKDAMKIAKLLKADGHMEPTEEQINAAIARFEAGETAGATGTGSGSETAADTAAEESEVEAKPEEKKKKEKAEAKPKKVKAT